MYRPVCLGQTCETRYQIVRHAFFRVLPHGSYDEFRRCVFDPAKAILNFDTLIFDWQVTQIHAVCAYLENDFQGIFERADLEVTADINNLANRRLDTTHPHSIHPVGEFLTEAELDEGYAEARSKIEHLADKFRRQLLEPEPRLYIFSQIPDPNQAGRLLRALGKVAKHPFRILFVGPNGADAEALRSEPRFDVRIVPTVVDKPVGEVWEGDDAAWEAILREFDLAIPPYIDSRIPKRLLSAR